MEQEVNAFCRWRQAEREALRYTISDIFQFSEEIQHLQVGDNDFLVSYHVTALFTNVPLEETIQVLAKNAFNGNWFNNAHNLFPHSSLLFHEEIHV